MLYNPQWNRATTSDLLNRAADLMETHGKANGVLMDFNGSMCIQGALMSAAGLTNSQIGTNGFCHIMRSENAHAYETAVMAVAKNLDPHGASPSRVIVGMWNNSSYTTKNKAVAKMREVAKELIDA